MSNVAYIYSSPFSLRSTLTGLDATIWESEIYFSSTRKCLLVVGAGPREHGEGRGCKVFVYPVLDAPQRISRGWLYNAMLCLLSAWHK